MSRNDDEPQDFIGRGGVALVTGGSGGIGAAICRLLARRGADVVLTYRSSVDAANAVRDDCVAAGRQCDVVRADLANSDDVAAVIRVAESRGGVHTLVHAAGPFVQQVHLSRVDPRHFEDQLRQEVVGFFNIVSPTLPLLRSSHGSIVAVTTAATQRYPVRDGLSPGTKAAIDALVRGLAAEEGRYGVRANSVGPGMLTDGMAQQLMASGDLHEEALAVTMRNIPLRRFGDAVDIAEAVCFLASDRADFISGQLLVVDGGYTV